MLPQKLKGKLLAVLKVSPLLLRTLKLNKKTAKDRKP
jgi:hypothetical protein